MLCNRPTGTSRSSTKSIPNICSHRSTDWAKTSELSSNSISKLITRIALTLVESPDQVNKPPSLNIYAFKNELFRAVYIAGKWTTHHHSSILMAIGFAISECNRSSRYGIADAIQTDDDYCLKFDKKSVLN